MKTKITLVLPLRGRLEHTRRWLAWSRAAGLDAPVILADGSDAAEVETTAALVAEGVREGRPWRHLALPGSAFHERVARAAAAVETPYAAMAANDDFPIAAGLEACARELDRRPELAVCGGDNGGVLLPSADGAVWSAKASASCGSGRRSVTGPDALTRMVAAIDAYDPSWYDLHRAEVLRSSMRALHESKVTDPYLGELLQALAAAAAGGVARVPACHLVRQIDAPGSASGAIAASVGDLLDEILKDGWHAQFELFLDAAARLAGGGDATRAALRSAYARYARATLARTPGFVPPAGPAQKGLAFARRAARALGRRLAPPARAARPADRAVLLSVTRFLAEGARP